MRVDWSEQALMDVEEIHGFIGRDAPVFAELFLDTVFHTARLLGPEHVRGLG